ncbi:MAG: hypothetical protein ABIJ18_02565 [archaeon]
MKKKKEDINKWPIPAFMLMGLGVGFLLLQYNAMAIPAGVLIGLGFGMLISLILERKKK